MATTLAEPGQQEGEALETAHSDLQAQAFQALEQRVLRAIELLRQEREQRAAAEQRAHQAEEYSRSLEGRLEEQASHWQSQLEQKSAEIDGHGSRLGEHVEQIRRLENELSQFQGERDQVRQRVERLLQHLDEINGA